MPTKKKAVTKSKAKARTSGVKRAAATSTRSEQQLTYALNIQLLTAFFALLAIVFAVEAYWQYAVR